MSADVDSTNKLVHVNYHELQSTPSITSFDYRDLDYAETVDRNLQCPICHCPFIEPVRLGCDHTFCGQCVRLAFESQDSSNKCCPSCRTDTDLGKLAPIPRFVVHMIDDLIVRCPRTEAGCDKAVRRGAIGFHVRFYCDYAEIACPSSTCTLSVLRKDLMKDCLHGGTDCPDCGVEVMQCDLKDHIRAQCSATNVICSHCSEQVPTKTRVDHESTCPEALIECPAATVGCKVVERRGAEPSHSRNCTLASLWALWQATERRSQTQDASLQALRREHDILKSSLLQMQGSASREARIARHFTRDSARTDEGPGREEVSRLFIEDQPFDSATHHLLSMHESLRGELNRMSSSLSEVEGRLSMQMINENLRIKEDLNTLNGIVNSTRMQLQWLAKTQRTSHTERTTSGRDRITSDAAPPEGPFRRLSDAPTKL